MRFSQTVLTELDRQIAEVSAREHIACSRPYYLRRLMHAIPTAPNGESAIGTVPERVHDDLRVLLFHCSQGVEHPSEELWPPLMQCLVTVSDRIVNGLVHHADTMASKPAHPAERTAVDPMGGLANTEYRAFDMSEPMRHMIVVNVSTIFFEHMKNLAKGYQGGTCSRGSTGVLSDLIRRALMGHPMPPVRSPETEAIDRAALEHTASILFLIKALLVMEHPVEHADMITQRLLACQHSFVCIRKHITNIAPLSLEDRPSVMLQAAQ